MKEKSKIMIRIRELRQSRGLSQQALADMFLLSQQSIYKYEHGLAEPDIDMLRQMAEYFEVSVDYLIGYSDIPVHYETLSHSGEMTRAERRLLDCYRSLSSKAQEAVQLLIDDLIEKYRKKA